MSSTNADIVILGAGSGGYACALRASQLGLSVVLIDEAELGGTCLHTGCVPTKALLHVAEVADQARDSKTFGVKATFDGIDMAGVKAFSDGVVARLYKGLQGLIGSRSDITWVAGTGTLTGPNTVEVAGTTYTGRHIVLATGSYSRTLPGLDLGGRIIASEQALTLDYVPGRVAVLGGGVIGVEFASIWRSFGADVTIIEALPHLVANEDESCSKALERAFRKRGIEFTTGVRFSSAVQTEDSVTVTLENATSIEADVLLVAVGRGPRTDGMGFSQVGIAMDRGFVLTDQNLATNIPSIFAVGDIVPGLQLAHRGFGQGIFVAEYLAGRRPRPIEDWLIPRVTYCEPEVASVGLTEVEAKEKFGAASIATYEYNLGGNGKSQILQTAGFVKLVQRKDGPIIGIHIVGSRASELIGEAQLIVNWEAEPDDVASLIHAHPTQNEALGEAHLALAGKPLHSHA